MIPKIIHYCWFGGKKKPRLVKDCILSWKKNLQGYKIIEWNEKNTDLSHPFVQQAYRMKKWAFVADFIRFKCLFEIGGIYLDTDMMLLKPLDVFLKNNCFFGAEEKNIVSCGIIGSKKNNNFIKDCLLSYDFIEFNNEIRWENYVITKIVTNFFKNKFEFHEICDSAQIFNDIVIYPPQVFYPFPFNKKDDLLNYSKYVVNESYAVHLWVGSWVQYTEFELIHKRQYIKAFRLAFINFFFKNKLSLFYLKSLFFSTIFSFKKNEF